jgi:hypothetical protein
MKKTLLWEISLKEATLTYFTEVKAGTALNSIKDTMRNKTGFVLISQSLNE